MNPLLFKSTNNDFGLSMLNDNPFFLLCNHCKIFPEISLLNKEYVILECNNCNKSKKEKIKDISNYSSEWVSNEGFNDIKTKKYYTKTELYYSYFCENCKFEFSEKNLNIHKAHNIVHYDEVFNLNSLSLFSEKIKNNQTEKYKYINQTLINLDNMSIKDKNILPSLKKIISNILEIYYKDLEDEQNLISFFKIIFATFRIIENEKNKSIKNYISILSNIILLFKKETIDEFKIYIKPFINKYETICDSLSSEEINKLNNFIKIIPTTNGEDKMDLKNQNQFLENNIKYSSSIKKYITVEKAKNPDNYININEVINETDDIYKDLNTTNEDFILSLFGKYWEDIGIDISVSKKKDKNLNDIELASLQTLFSFGNQKKYELHFDFGQEINEKIINDEKEKEKFLYDYKMKIAEKLNIESDRLILTDVHRGSLGVFFKIINSTLKEVKSIFDLKNCLNIKKVEEKPLLEMLQISPDILYPKANRYDGWGLNETRGGEKYLPPINGWYGFGLNVLNKYDNGNNDWLDYQNTKIGEYSIAYLAINNLENKKTEIIEDLNDFSTNINDKIVNKLYVDDLNIRNKNEKCGDGVIVFQNPDFAENSAGFIDIFGYRIKIILMCRINPKKIKQPEHFPECWILDPNSIRPYRILIKKIPFSPLTDSQKNLLTTCVSPTDYIVNAIKSCDTSLIKLKNNNKFKSISTLDGKFVKDDFFAIRLYSSCYYSHINEYLRNQKILNTNVFNLNHIESWIYLLHLSLSRNYNVKNDTIVYRGVKLNFPPNIQIGSKFYFKEFISTSIKRDFSIKWINGKGTLMDITIKNNGINGHPNYCYYIEDITVSKNQYEVLISCLCYFQVTKREKKGEIDYVSLVCEGYLIP